LDEKVGLTAIDEDAGDAQRRHLTVMFSDVVGSTALAEQLDPEDFRDVLSGYHAGCTRAIGRFNGYVAQYQGDGVVAYFGFPRAHEDDALRAVRASLAILDEVAGLNGRLRALLGVELQIRIGLHTGIVVAGEIGSGPSRERHAAVGETLHIAERVQSIAPSDSIVLTDATLALVTDRVKTEILGTKELKGISRPTRVHTVVRSPDGVATRDRPVPALRTRLIDRVRELAPLLEAWQRARRSHGTIVHVAGEAGIGKSTLVLALRERVREQAGAEHILQCSPHQSSSPLHPTIGFLERITDLDRSQPPERQLEALERCVAAVALDPPEIVPLLADLLSIPFATAGRPHMAPRDARNATLRALEELLVGEASGHPLLLVVEDLHWSDPTTIELLERIVNNIERLPMACILTFRGDFQPPWTQWREDVNVDLGPLSTADVREMASAVSTAVLDAEALTRVESAAEGVPLFVEEMVKSIGVGSARDRLSESRVPTTLQGLLTERLDCLPELAGLIDVAAVLGHEFDRGLLQALSGLDRRGFRSAVALLTAEEVLQPVEGSRTRLEFRHTLLQEVAYDRLLRRRRRALHASVAELLATRPPSVWEAEPERIAHHWTYAEEPARALPYWERAGRRALGRAAFLEAAAHFRQAVQALDATRPAPEGELERGDLLTRIGAATQAGHTPAADVDVVYARARSAFEHTGERDRLIPVIRGEYLLHVARAQYVGALELAEEMLSMARKHEHTPWRAEGLFYLGFARMLRGELDRARADLEEASTLYRPVEHAEDIYEAQSDPGVAALAYLANLLWNQGHAREAIQRSDQSLDLAGRVGGPVTLGLAWGMRCGLMLVRGISDDFGVWLEKARGQSVDGNIGYWSTVCSIWSAWVAGLTADAQAAIAVLQQHIDGYLKAGGRVGLPHFQALLAEVQLAAGNHGRALEALAAAQRHIDATGERYYEPELQWLTARVLAAGDARDVAAATAAYERAINSAHGQNAKLLELRSATGLAIHQRRSGEPPTTLALVESLCEWFADEPEVLDVRRARALLKTEA
jgi:class 3 adenylate cyclase/tetratricopeptide (TPR) repeat protein/energy-coupling factor transporter ATP-binding protein EcfA2